MIKVSITTRHEIDDKVAAMVGEQFMEWLDSNGWCLVPKAFAAKHNYKETEADEPYVDLATQWVREYSQ